MSCETDTGELLRRTGRRSTQQRRLIAAALRHAGAHHSARELWELVQERRTPAEANEPPISPSTVYRTLEALRSMRLVSAVEDAGGRTTYAWIKEAHPHLHLVCRGCGESGEVSGDVLATLIAEIEARSGFEPFLDHLSVMGRCRACRDASPDATPDALADAVTQQVGSA